MDRTRGRLDMFTGNPGRATKVLLDAAESQERESPGWADGAFADAAMSAFLAGDPVRAVDLAFRAQTPSDRPGDQVELISGLIIGTALTHLGRVPEGLRMLRESAAIVRQHGLDLEDLEYAVFTALAHAWVGDLPAARALSETLVHDLRRQSALGILPLALYAAAYIQAMSGRFSSASTQAAEAVELAHDTGNSLWSFFGLSCLALIEAHQGDETPCRKHAIDALTLLGSFDLQYPRDALDALGLLELSLGRPGAALQHLEAAHQDPQTDTPPVFDGPPGADLVEAYVRSDGPVPDDILAQVESQSGNLDFAINAALAWRCRGLLADDESFTACFVQALDLHAHAGSPYDQARTQFCFGERLRRTGRRRDSRRQLREAYEQFAQLGANQWARRSAEELRATGERVRKDPAAPPEKLTPQERSVASAVANGATNNEAAAALFLSPKTIEAHLGRVYRKLGIRSRSELAASFRQST
ncbi:helix-turn-helix transcriptional regulator [Actinomadura fulvescens]|uniref:helix-turn-helix transcriptional regulator n=1 Tax=Actinomadura fulvescens TaxID=46160 RepID=UPI0031E24214